MEQPGSGLSAIVRSEETIDHEMIHALHTAAFGQPAEAELVAQMRANGNLRLSLVAVLDGVLVGHVAFSPVRTAGQPDAAAGLGLAPLGVLPLYQRRGIGSRLVREGLERSRQAGVGFVVLVGDPAYYARFGFTTGNARGLRNEYTTGSEFQILELRPGAAPAAGALVVYGEEFRPWGR